MNFWLISLLFAEIQNVNETRPMLYNGICGCHGNICYVILINASFCKVHNIGAIDVRTNFEINRYKIDEFRKHAKIVCFIWRHVTQKWYVVRHGGCILLIGITIRKILKPTRSIYDFRLMVNLLCKLGQLMTRYDFLGTSRVILCNIQTDSKLT